VAYVSKIFLGKFLYLLPLTNRTAWGKVSLKSLEITNDNRAVSSQLIEDLILLIADSQLLISY